MKSPFTGKEMPLKRRIEKFAFRKKEFEIVYHYYYCADTKEQMVDTKLATLNQNQIHNKYRVLYGIPFVDTIKAIRAQYQVSAKKLSEILGFGVNSYRLYENGEVPSVANGRLILSIKNPTIFILQVEASTHLLSEKDKNKLITQAKSLLNNQAKNIQNIFLHPYRPSLETGFKSLDIQAVLQLIAFFQETMPLYKTKLNKLLFYADFAVFKEVGYSLTGLKYRAIQFGPVPKDYGQIYSYLENQQKISIKEVSFSNGSYGEEIKIKASLSYTFSEDIDIILNNVRKKLKPLNTLEIVNLSHQEKAWIDNEKNKNIISYEDGFWMIGV